MCNCELVIKEKRNTKEFKLKAATIEDVLDITENTLQLWMGIQWLKNWRKNWFYSNYESVIYHLKTKKVINLHENISLRVVSWR